MASGFPVILRLTPIISSTSTIWYAWDQYEQMTLFLQGDLRALSNQILPRYFTLFFNRGLPRVLGLLATTAVSCGSVLRYAPGETGAFPWYVAGAVLAVAHMTWAPSIIPPVKAIKADGKEKNTAHLERWLRLHVWRSLTVDLGAWVCCVVATSKSFS